MGVKGLTPGRENSLGGDHMVFRGNEGGIGCRTAEHKGGGAMESWGRDNKNITEP